MDEDVNQMLNYVDGLRFEDFTIGRVVWVGQQSNVRGICRAL